jgi:hypothetical protein
VVSGQRRIHEFLVKNPDQCWSGGGGVSLAHSVAGSLYVTKGDRNKPEKRIRY